MASPRSFRGTVEAGPKGRIFVRLPFDPDEAWGPKSVHRVGGALNGTRIRAVVEPFGQGAAWRFVLGPAWVRDRPIAVGDEVEVTLTPEGPQRDDLAEDILAAFEAEPAAGAFFDSLAQFYRRGYLRWIDATKRRPDVRAARIAEMVELLKAGAKERP